MVLKRVIFIVGLLALTSCDQGEISTVSADDSNVEVNGRLLFKNQCASCHGMDGALGNSGSKNLSISKLNEEAVMKILMEGKGTMPPFEYLLTTEKEREAVVEYVMSLRKEEN